MDALKKLANKIRHKINEAVTDPEAEAVAAEKEREQAIEEAKQEEEIKEAEETKEKEAQEAEENKSDSQVVKEIAIKVGVSFIGIATILLFGSLICNVAIYRHTAIRLLYFFYGTLAGVGIIVASMSFPPLILIILAAVITCYMFEIVPHWYAFAPLTIVPPSDNFFSRLFKAPFYWNPEDPEHKPSYLEAIAKYKGFLESQLMKPS
jgi:hypothetical protein